jgi:excisionase family DNA binding protein
MKASEVAEFLGVSVDYVYMLGKSGELPSLKFGGNTRFERFELERWLREHS